MDIYNVQVCLLFCCQNYVEVEKKNQENKEDEDSEEEDDAEDEDLYSFSYW